MNWYWWLARVEVDLVREARRVGRERDVAVVDVDDPRAFRQLLVDHVAEQAALLVVVVRAGRLQLLRDRGRGHRRRDDLLRGMVQGRAGREPVVAEEQDVLEARIAQQVADPDLAGVERRGLLQQRQLVRLDAVHRRLDHDLVRADPAHPVVHAVAAAIGLALDREGGGLVGDHAHQPAGRVRATRLADRVQLGRGGRLAARAEGARGLVLGRDGRREVELRRAAAALDGDVHPAAIDRVVAQFAHRTVSLTPAYRAGRRRTGGPACRPASARRPTSRPPPPGPPGRSSGRRSAARRGSAACG